MIDTIGNPDYGPKPCPLRDSGAFNASGEWLGTFGNQTNNPGGIYLDWSNPYKPSYKDDVGNVKNNNPFMYDYEGKFIKDDKYVGNIHYRIISDTEISLSSCWKTPCSSPENRGETIIDFSDY